MTTTENLAPEDAAEMTPSDAIETLLVLQRYLEDNEFDVNNDSAAIDMAIKALMAVHGVTEDEFRAIAKSVVENDNDE